METKYAQERKVKTISQLGVIVKKSKIHGKGVFALRDFHKGEIVLKWDVSRELSPNQVKKMTLAEKAYVSNLNGKFIEMQPPERYVNRSCDPNTSERNFSDIAKREIKKGEEITSDYSATGEDAQISKCNCGSENCRDLFVCEGSVKIKAPSQGSSPKESAAFYNPRMKLNRDLSMLVAREFFKNRKAVEICEPFSATGIRAIRYAKEVEGKRASGQVGKKITVYAGDISKNAVELIKQNAELNKAKNIEVFHGYAEKLMEARKYDLIDLDPFGTPAPYVDSALAGLKPNGMLAATATDMMALCGVAPKQGTAMPKYLGAKALKCEFVHEIAVRLLLGLIARKSKLQIKPLLSLSTDHYIRVFVKIGGQVGKRAGGQDIGFVNYNPKTGARSVSKTKKSGNKHAGPLWIGKIQDKTFIGKLLRDQGTQLARDPGTKLGKILETIYGEANGKPLFYTTRELVKGEQPKIEVLLKKYKATRTHFKPQALRLKS